MKRTEWLLVLLVFMAGLLFHGSTMRGGNLGLIGEGVACVGAQRVLEGQVPYRDFWTVYAPGGYYMLAALFAVFGSQILVERMLAVVLISLTGAMVYGLMRTTASRWVALVWGIALSLALFPRGHIFGTYPPVALCLTTALWAAANYFGAGRTGWLIAAGAACSGAIIFKHDVGGYVAIAILFALLVRPRQPSRTQVIELKISRLREITLFLIASASLAVPVYSIVWAVAGDDMWRDLVYFPLTDFAASRAESFPGRWPIRENMTSIGRAIEELSLRTKFAIPPLVFLGSIAQLVIQRLRLPPARFATQVMLTAAMPFFWYAAHVQVNTHIFSLVILSAAIGAMWFTDLIAGRMIGRIASACAITALLAFGFLPRPMFEVGRAYFGENDQAPINVDRARGISCDTGVAVSVRETIEYIHRHTESDEPVYVGPLRHDVIVASPTMLYFLMERPIPVRYHEMHPAIADVDRHQAEMVADLKRQNVRYAILWRRFTDKELDDLQERRRESLPDTGATRMDEYFHANFEHVETFGRFQVFRRRRSASG